MESQTSPCSEECSCDDNPPECMDGVDVIKDGCCGCLVCARQQGEDCNQRFKCDTRRFLYCDHKDPGNLYGICRAKRPEHCQVNGKTYRDGEHFKPDCRRLCTCQDGQYACSSLCPHEDFPPSTQFCEIALLVDIPGQCCKEWACTKERPDPAFQLKTTTALMPTNDRECERKTTPWASCSVTCGMGVAYRLTNDNTDCIPIKQKRLCFLRPCNLRDNHMRGHMCKSTWKSGESGHLEYEGCTSVKKYRPKYCSTCKKNRCCTPDITKTITVEFECSGNRETIMNLMWIKSCACNKRCNFH